MISVRIPPWAIPLRATLRSLIADIDRHYFTAGITNANTLDLEAIVTKWLTTANRAATPA